MKSLPNRPLSNFDIEKFIKLCQIPYFRGIFMRDNLPNKKAWKNECMIVNHDSIKNNGTHWTCYVKNGKNVYYFDSFGKLAPPLELIQYLGSDSNIHYNADQYQKFNTTICGHLCLQFLYAFYKEN